MIRRYENQACNNGKMTYGSPIFLNVQGLYVLITVTFLFPFHCSSLLSTFRPILGIFKNRVRLFSGSCTRTSPEISANCDPLSFPQVPNILLHKLIHYYLSTAQLFLFLYLLQYSIKFLFILEFNSLSDIIFLVKHKMS